MVNAEMFTEELLKELAFTKEEREMLAKARQMPITFDDDCPPTTPERALKFRRVNPPRRDLEGAAEWAKAEIERQERSRSC